MEIFHKIEYIDGISKTVIYVKYPDSFEFGLDFDKFNKNVKSVSNKIKEYIIKNFKEIKDDTALLVLNGIVVGTIVFSSLVWRGPVIAGVIQQFWSEVVWGDVDYMFVDMPPGTGDVPLTVFQSLPVDGIIIVSTPQDLVTMIVKKAFNMAKMMNIPVLGLVENMSYVLCPDCGREIKVFGESRIDETAKELGVPVLGRIPMEENTAKLVDKGAAELVGDKYIKDAVEVIEKL